MKIGVDIGDTMGPVTLNTMVGRARRARELGLHSVWMGQFVGWDILTALALVGREVPDLELGTAIVPTYPRHPLALASQVLSVQAATGNRLQLGLGPSHRTIIEEWYGLDYGRPARHMREYLEALRPLLRQEQVSYQGETLRAQGKLTVLDARPPALLISALGPVMLRLAGELTDGTVTAWAGPRAIAEHIAPRLNEAAEAAGRPRPRIVAGVLVHVTDKPAMARQRVGEQFSAADHLPSYRAMMDIEGVATGADLLLAGDEAEVTAGLRAYQEAGATEFVAFFAGPDEERPRTEALLSRLAAEG
jgi:F420-dependent oxidoreductase-like protein